MEAEKGLNEGGSEASPALRALEIEDTDLILDAPTSRPWPADGEQHEIAFAVSADGDAFLVIASEAVINANEECAGMEKAGWGGLPTAPGFYKARAEFWFQQGYYEGYPAPRESSWGFSLVDCSPVGEAPPTSGGTIPSNENQD